MTDSTSVLVPAFNQGSSIAALVTGLRAAANWHEIIVVDDGSRDDTGTVAAAAGARVVRHPHRKGHGTAIKTGIREASGSLVLMMDAGSDYRPADAVTLVRHLDAYELVVGARPERTQASAISGGTGPLNWLASYLTEQTIPDLTSGFVAARRACLMEFLHLLPSGFSTPTTTMLAFIKGGYSVRFEPIQADPRPSAERPGFFLVLLKVITIYSPLRIFLPISAAAFGVGAAYAVWTILVYSHVTNSSVVLILLSVVVFLVGLISEQVSSLRFAGPRQ